jgi:peptide/nickel transport system substrate-binding protein
VRTFPLAGLYNGTLFKRGIFRRAEKPLTYTVDTAKLALRKGISVSEPKQEENNLRLQHHSRVSRGAVVAAIAAGSLLIVSALSSATAATPSSARKSADKLVLAALQDPGTLDVVKQNQTALVLWLPGNVYETLVTNKPDGTAGPGVAKSWVISKDQLTYTFTIRDAKFSDGAAITADDVVYSLNAMKDGPIGSYKGPFVQVDTIVAKDAKTVVIKLKQSSRSFFRGMGEMSGIIQPAAGEATRATAPIGSGPYVLKEYVPNDRLVFIPNTLYSGKAPSLKEVTVKIMTDGNAALAALKAGEIDSFPVITIDLWERIGKQNFDKDFTLQNYPQGGEMLYMLFNSNKAPYNDPKLRHALAKMIDRKAFNVAYGAPKGSSDPTCGYGLQNTSWFAVESKSTCVDPYDPKKGAAELKAAGYSKTALDYVSLTDVPDLSLPATLQIAQLKKAGVTIKRNAISLAEYSKTIFSGRPQQFGVSIMSDPALFTQFSCTDKTKAGWHTYCSKELTDLIVKADGAKTKASFESYMKKAAAVLQKDAYIVPILAKAGVGLWQPDLKGWNAPRIFVEQNFADLSWK